MTDVTRIACPGCRSPLRFEPEALDFPANCGVCDCRFTAGVYVRITCPGCHNGSRIRECYLGQRLRCARCRHDFLSDEGIPPGGGGRLLVARLLDTDLAEPPETFQAFLGHARVEAERRASTLEDQWALEAERLRARAGLEREALSTAVDRLNWAVHSAKGGEAEALRRLEESARGLMEAESSLAAERRRSLELDRIADGLKGEIRALRAALAEAEGPRVENERIAEAVDRLLEENRTLNGAVDRLLAENGRMAAEVKAVRSPCQQQLVAARNPVEKIQ